MNNFIPLSAIKQEVDLVKRVYHFGRLVEFLEASKDKLILFRGNRNEVDFAKEFISMYNLVFPNFAFSDDELPNILCIENISTLISEGKLPYTISKVEMTRPEDLCVMIRRKYPDIPDKDFFNQCIVDILKAVLLE